MGARDTTLLFVLGALFGAAFLFIRVAAPEFGPFVLMDLRVALGGVLVLAISGRAGLAAIRSRWQDLAVAGALSAAIPFTLIATAELSLTASVASIINATTPLFTAIFAAIVLTEAITPRRLVGLIGGILGVGIVVGWSTLPPSSSVLLSAGLSVLAAASYAAGGVWARLRLRDTPTLPFAAGMLVFAAVLLAPFSLATIPERAPSPHAIAALAALVVLSTAIVFVIYAHLIRSVGPTSTLTATFLAPVFGVVLGALLLGEELSPGLIVGLSVILVSVALVTNGGASVAKAIRAAVVAK